MILPAVLIVGSPRDAELGDLIFDAGLTPVFRESVLSAITALRKDNFLAVVVDRKTSSVDPLELILNVRDVDERTRIFVVSEEREAVSEMLPQPYVSLVSKQELARKLAPTVVPVEEGRPLEEPLDVERNKKHGE
jgi:hypothetical protein